MRRTGLLLVAAALAMLLAGTVVVAGQPEQAEADSSTNPGKIAFVSRLNLTGNTMDDIYTMNPDGSRVTELSRPGDQSFPAISPDGRKIAYFDYTKRSLYVMNADGSGQDVQVSSTNVYASYPPSWSPDGEKLVFADAAYYPGAQFSNTDIFVANADGSGQPVNLTNTSTPEDNPSWSPDGQKIAFGSSYGLGTSEREDNSTGDIYTINSDGSGRENVTNTRERHEGSPSWSPDGQKITHIASDVGGTSLADVFVMNADGSGQTMLTDTWFIERLPSFSPDSKRIAFQAYSGNDVYDIVVINADGSGKTNITGPDWYLWSSGLFPEYNPAFSHEWAPSWGVSDYVDNFSGFFSPVDNPDVATNRVKAGSAVPVKFSLGGNQGLDIFAPGYPLSRQIPNPQEPLDGVEQTVSAGSSGLTYDADTDRYTYIWKTEKAWAGQYRQLVLRFADGTTKVANFNFTK